MKKLALLATLVTALVLPAVAAASPGGGGPRPATSPKVAEPSSVAFGVGLPIYRVASDSFRPPGFVIDAGQARGAAESSRQMVALHAREHPMEVIVKVWLGRSWLVDFYYRDYIAAEVVVTRAGQVTGVWTGPQALAVYTRGDFATRFGKWWVLVPFSLLFLAPFLDIRRPRRLLHVDALVLLSFLVSYLLFDHAKLVPAVWAVYPPLIYLVGRLLWIGGLRPRSSRSTSLTRRSPTLAPLLSLPILATGLALLIAARIVLSLLDPTVADVGYASVLGAHQIAGGHSIYFQSAANGDTYGPITYLAYLPFELLFPWHGSWDYLPSAHAASLAFDLVTVGGLVALGRQFRPGQEGWRLGLAMGWAWSACPFTLLALMMHTNDGLIAMLSVLSLLALRSPTGRGALLGLAAAAKFAPAALLGLYANDGRRNLRGALICVASFLTLVIVVIAAYLPPGGIAEFYRQTLGFQLTRSDVFSPWALHPGLDPVKSGLEVLIVLLCVAVTFFPRKRSAAQIAALGGALTIAVQLPAVHWFYYYIVWFMPYAIVALLAAPGNELECEPAAETVQMSEPAELVLTGA